MSILFGKTRSFGISIQEIPGKLADPDPSAEATWAEIAFWIQGRNICAHTHRDSEEFHGSVIWPAVYIARWISQKWSVVFEKQKLRSGYVGYSAHDWQKEFRKRVLRDDPNEDDPLMQEYDTFSSAHFLLNGVFGGAFPDVGVMVDADQVIVSVENDVSGESDVFFSTNSLCVRLPVEEFVEPFRGLVAWVANRLSGSSHGFSVTEGKRLQEWLNYLSESRCGEQVFTGSIGFSVAELNRIDKAVCKTSNLSRFIPTDFSFDTYRICIEKSAPLMLLRSSSPVLTEEDVTGILSRVASVGPQKEADAALHQYWSLINSRCRPEKDFEDGYVIAALVREEIRNVTDRIDIEDLVKTLGIPIITLDICDPDIDGAAFWDEHIGPLILINAASHKSATPWGRRMTLSHELGHLLFDRNQFVPLGVFSGPWASPAVERRANGFAAEFLVPKAGLVQYFQSHKWQYTDECIRDLADRFFVGHTMIFNHLNNRLKDEMVLPSA